MRRARIIVRDKIINYNMKLHTDIGLQVLDGIYYSPFETFDDYITAEEICESLEQKYKKEYSHLHVDSVELQFDTEK